MSAKRQVRFGSYSLPRTTLAGTLSLFRLKSTIAVLLLVTAAAMKRDGDAARAVAAAGCACSTIERLFRAFPW